MKKLPADNRLSQAFRSQDGLALLQAIILISIVASLLLIIVSVTLLGLNVSKQGVRRTAALHIAEAGINYYLWHLVHDPADYCDGNPCVGSPPYGPFVHDFHDNTGKKIGSYTLWIAPPSITDGSKVVICHTPPATNETISVAPSAVQGHLDHGDFLGPCEGGGTGGGTVVVESRGDVEDGNENRTIVAALGIPSFAQYAVVANDTVNHIRFGEDTEIFGPIHNNGGVRFDGVAHDLVTSAMAEYNDPDHDDIDSPQHSYHPDNILEPGVHTHVPPDEDRFLGGKSFPVPPVDFAQVTADLNEIETQATDDGYYYGPTGAGYHIVLGNNNYTIYRVNSVTASCNTSLGWQPTYGISSQSVVAAGVSYPTNGVIFVDDNLWVDGKIMDVALTIASSEEIYINNDIEYTYLDGRDKLGLIAQENISVGLYSEGSFSGSSDQRELTIHAALLAQNGRVGRNYYPYRYRQFSWQSWSYCLQSSDNYWQRNKISVYGSLATNRRYGFSWICGDTWTIGDYCDSGYDVREVTYDENLSASPPPSFPTIGNYAILDWREK
ncbi:MAG: hypothetical protein WD187_00530 [Candidatus Woykebacteria bacterium]